MRGRPPSLDEKEQAQVRELLIDGYAVGKAVVIASAMFGRTIGRRPVDRLAEQLRAEGVPVTKLKRGRPRK